MHFIIMLIGLSGQSRIIPAVLSISSDYVLVNVYAYLHFLVSFPRSEYDVKQLLIEDCPRFGTGHDQIISAISRLTSPSKSFSVCSRAIIVSKCSSQLVSISALLIVYLIVSPIWAIGCICGPFRPVLCFGYGYLPFDDLGL